MAASAVITYENAVALPLKRIIIAWVSAADGSCIATTTKVRGKIIKGVTFPGAAAPTDGYNVVITDENGVNVLALSQANLTNRSATLTQQVNFNLKPDGATVTASYPIVSDVLTVTLDSAGSGKAGTIILYVDGSAGK